MQPQFQDVSTIISLLPIPLKENKPGLQPGNYLIPAADRGDFVVVHIARAQFPVYIDENRPALIVPEPSDLVAESICRDYKTSTFHYAPGEAEPGLFWVKDAWKKQDILAGASEVISALLVTHTAMQIEWFKRLVEEADDVWGRFRVRKMISDIMRLAAVHLNIEREWNIDTIVEKALSVCKYCRSQISRDAIVCPHCHGVLDMEAYKRDFVSAKNMGNLVSMGLVPTESPKA